MTTDSIPSGPCDELAEIPLLRPGAVARQLGMSVETLRAWENRYGITASQHSDGGQRLYSQDDLLRLGWIKKLVDAGHRISKLVGLSPEALQSLVQSLAAEAERRPQQIGAMAASRLALVGPWISAKSTCDALTDRRFIVTAALRSLEELDVSRIEGDLLLVESAVLDIDLDASLEALRRASIQVPITILYRFGSPEAVARLSQAGYQLVRKPAEGIQPEWLCDLIMRLQSPPSTSFATPADAVSAPLFSEDDLVRLTEASDQMQCECPRHLAELLAALSSFERYSRQCEGESEEEAALHRELCIAAGHARLPLENALLRLTQVKGIDLSQSAK